MVVFLFVCLLYLCVYVLFVLGFVAAVLFFKTGSLKWILF